MRRIAAMVICLVALLCGGSGAGVASEPAAEASDPSDREITISMPGMEPSREPGAIDRPLAVISFFIEACLDSLPEGERLVSLIRDRKLTVLPMIATLGRTGGRPGRGWVQGHPESAERMELILEEGEHRSCGVVAHSGDPGTYDLLGQTLIQSTVISRGGRIGPIRHESVGTSEHGSARGYSLKLPQDPDWVTLWLFVYASWPQYRVVMRRSYHPDEDRSRVISP